MTASMDQKNYLITGGSGFIGKHLTRYLLSRDKKCLIHILDILPPAITDERVSFHEYDIRYKINLDIEGRNLVCYHLAALAKDPGYEWEEYFLTNLRGTDNLIEFAEKNQIANILFTSTMMVYRAGDQRMSETSLTAPDSAYGISKLLAEYSLKSWVSKSPQRRLRVVRAPVVFGKGENGNFTRLYRALKKNKFFYIGRSDTVKSCIYVKDLVGFLVLLSEDNAEAITYNIAYPDSTTIETICKAFMDVFKFKARIMTMPYRLAIALSYFFEYLNSLEIIKTDVHHRRIQKLYFSTNISADLMEKIGYNLSYSLVEALKDWEKDCLPHDIC
jgi:GlcNAc-P-P-Und epimerase